MADDRKLEEIVEVFEKFRKEWKEKVSGHTKMLIDLKDTHLLQMGALNDRQFLVEYKARLLHQYAKANQGFRKEKYKILDEYTNEKNIRYNAQEKEIVIEGKLANIFQVMDTFKAQIEYVDQTVKTIDSIIWAVKDRIKLEDYKY